MVCLFFFKQKTSYDMRISDWSSDLCSSDLAHHQCAAQRAADDLVRLVESQMLEGDDTLCRARLAVAQFDDPRPGADRVARKDGLGKARVGHSEIGDRRAERRVLNAEPDDQPEGEDRDRKSTRLNSSH